MEHAGSRARYESGEIDIHKLLVGLWAERLLILAVTLVVAVGTAAYVFLATPYYEVTSMLRPTAAKDLHELNSMRVYTLTPDEALQRVGAELASYENRLAFFKQNEARFEALRKPEQSTEQAFDEFNQKSIKVLQPDPKKNDQLSPYVGLAVTYPKGVDGVDLTNEFVRFVIERERRKLEGDFAVIVQNKLVDLERKIEAARAGYEANKDMQVAKLLESDGLRRAELADELKALRQELRTRRNNRIKQLDEAIAIATSLGIQKPTTPSSMGESLKENQGNVIRTEVTNRQIPLYFMGSEALEAERNALLKRRSDDFTDPRIAEIEKELQLLKTNRKVEVLKSRKDEDLFLEKLAAWREQAARLRNLRLDFSSLALVRIDQYAIEPSGPVKPKKALMLAAGVVVGMGFGIFIALLRRMVRKEKMAAH